MIVCLGWYCTRLHQSCNTTGKRLMGLVIVAMYKLDRCCVSPHSTVCADKADQADHHVFLRLSFSGHPC
jgi:hypothetical protein